MANPVSHSESLLSERLHMAPIGLRCVVRAVLAPDDTPELKSQLEDIGFFPGEPVLVTARGFPGREPLAVRVGETTFALRAVEAACIEVEKLPL